MELFSRITGLEGASPVVVIHGLFGASDNLKALATSLSSNYEVHTLDVRNHGQSPHDTEMNYDVMANDVVRYAKKHMLRKVDVIGHSMGGKVAMKLALDNPELVRRLIVADIAPVNYPPHHTQIFKAFAALDLKKIKARTEAFEVFSKFIDELSVIQFLLKSLVKSSDGVFKWRFNLAAIEDNYKSILSDQLGEAVFTGDVLFISGELSDYVLPEHRGRIISLFPNVKSKRIQGVGHWLHAEKPELFNGICLRFLSH